MKITITPCDRERTEKLFYPIFPQQMMPTNEMMLCLLAKNKHQDVGFVMVQLFPLDEVEVLFIAVVDKWRKNGVGTQLFNDLFQELQKKKYRILFLDVQEENKVARSFYTKQGFVVTGKRKNYYNKRSDAILMQLIL